MLLFVLLVASISAPFFALTRIVPGADSPERLAGFLVWLPMVWSPTLAAVIVARARGELGTLVRRWLGVAIPATVWVLMLVPVAIAVAAIVVHGHGAHWDRLGPGTLLLLLAIHLPLGPLGEEAGWRGFMQPHLDPRLGPLGSTLVVGAVWAAWHLPLWTVDSPQAEAPFGLFAAHVICHALLIGAVVRHARGSLIPAVLLHLMINAVMGAVSVVELSSFATWLAWTLPGHAAAAALGWRLVSSPASQAKVGRFRHAASTVVCVSGALIFGWALALVLAAPEVPAVRDERGRPIPGHLASIEHPRIGGIRQAIILRGRDDALPIALFVHGGPGTPETAMLLELIPELSNHVILAAWEQRGAGKSYGDGVAPESLTIERMVRDLHDVTDWLLERFDREKVVLIAHSWGTVLAMQALAERPERYSAYVGIGQVANPAESERMIYAWAVGQARLRGDEDALRELVEIGPPEGGDYRDGYRGRARLGQLIVRYGGAIAGRSDNWPYIRAVITTPVYDFREKLAYARGEELSLRALWTEMQSHDVSREVQRVEVPVWLVHGRHDWQTPIATARDYFEALEAPAKRFVVFESSAHSPIFEEPLRFLELLESEVSMAWNASNVPGS